MKNAADEAQKVTHKKITQNANNINFLASGRWAKKKRRKDIKI